MHFYSTLDGSIDGKKAISIVENKVVDIAIGFTSETDINIDIGSNRTHFLYISLYAKDYTKKTFINVLDVTKKLSEVFKEIKSIKLCNSLKNIFSSERKYILDIIPSIIGQHYISSFSINQGQEQLLEYIQPHELIFVLNIKSNLLNHPDQLNDELHSALETSIQILKTTKTNIINLLFHPIFHRKICSLFDICKQYLGDQPYQLKLDEVHTIIIIAN